MHPACKTLYRYAPYPLLAGLGMVLNPELSLQLLGLPIAGTDWMRMLGVVTVITGYYYWQLGRADVLVFCRWATQMRLLIPFIFAAMVLAFDMHPIYIGFTVPDFIGGLWTAAALRRTGLGVFRAAV